MRASSIALLPAAVSRWGQRWSGSSPTASGSAFAVRTKMRRAAQVSEAYGVDGVPAMAVNGKYYTSPSMAGSNQASLRVMDWLIAQERRARK